MGDIYEAAAQANINERFAPTYLHDVRGTMQALFSAVELLLRSAQSGADPTRVEKASELAKRAMAHHERATTDIVQLLTLERNELVDIDLNRLVQDVAHFLRNAAAVKGVKISVAPNAELVVTAERGKLRTLLVGLFAAGIDSMAAGEELHVSTLREEGDAVVAIGSDAGFAAFASSRATSQRAEARIRANDLTFLFAERFLTDHGGDLTLEHVDAKRRTLKLRYPCASFAQARASATEK